jgi:hypothetical protein
MFTFFGLFADPVRGLSEQISETWRGITVIELEQPIPAIGARFGRDHYQPEREDIPKPLIQAVEKLSAHYPDVRFLLLRTECFGGICANWGQIIRDGRMVLQDHGDGALGRLINYWGADLGPTEMFAPRLRDFPWERR